MSIADQCPSTHGPKAKSHRPGKTDLLKENRRLSSLAGGPQGMTVWRSIDEAADSPDFREFLEREFPAGASELERAEAQDAAAAQDARLGENRRDFLKYMGASIALAGAATIPGCRRPDHKIMPYSASVPEEIIPGKPLYYATSFPRPDGGAEGLLIETHEGRPTKIEGNPLHPMNNGRVSTWALASIMGLYDPERLKNPVYMNPKRGRVDASWTDFRAWALEHYADFDRTQGAGLAFLVEKKNSPTRDAMRDEVLKRWPKATWVAYDPTGSSHGAQGTSIAFGAPMNVSHSFDLTRTKVVLSLDADFLYRCQDEVRNSRGFASTRRVMKPGDPMSRLYVVESGYTITGGQADHRLRLAPSMIPAFAVELAKFIAGKAGDRFASVADAASRVAVPAGSGIPADWVSEAARDLLNAENLGKSLVIAGESQPPAVHALVAALNDALGNVGRSVTYTPMSSEQASDSHAMFAELVNKINKGEVKSLVCIDANPVHTAPGDIDVASAMRKLAASVTLSVQSSETAAVSTWSLNGPHFLETWGDTQSLDGTIAPIQPMIAPLYTIEDPPMSEIELLFFLSQKEPPKRVDGYEIVRSVWKKTLGGGDFEKSWRRSLHDGLLVRSSSAPQSPRANFAEVASAVSGLRIDNAPTSTSLDVVFTTGHLHDGRYANNPWLQELPEVGTRTTWDNPALLSPKTAESLGLSPVGYREKDPGAVYTTGTYPTARMAEISIGGRKMKLPVWILPGMADDTVMLTYGYGREQSGRVGDGVGFNVNAVRASSMGGARIARGASLTKVPGDYLIASTQNHWSMEGRTSLVRAVDLAAWNKHGAETQKKMDALYPTEVTLNFAERLGELSHTPPNESIYVNPYNATRIDSSADSIYGKGPQWAMTIDLSTCTGCGACTVACQSENNIPVVGKKEVAKGREMTWIRVDRYFVSDTSDGKLDVNSPSMMYHQPVACVHCENAPCETVCPVNATVHGPEGLNYMTYNRCIGTRYCANNCPYKVRRFNFFDYGVTKFNGDYYFKDSVEAVAGGLPGQGLGLGNSGKHNKVNPNLIPPRLRQKLDEITRMSKNPDVTVRSRGVMEKCSYCIQRINAARIETKLDGLKGIPDGFFQTACQQSCPSEAIVFGDMLDPKSKVHETKRNARSYALLGYLNTRPRTSHMVRVMNPNPKLRHEHDDPFHHGGHHHHDHAGRDQGPGQNRGFVAHSEGTESPSLGNKRSRSLSLRVLTNGGHA